MGLFINGKHYSYASVEASYMTVAISRTIVQAISEISYGQTIERERVWGTGPHDLGETDGRVVPDDGSLTLRKLAFDKLIDALGDGYGNVELLWVFKYRNGVDPVVKDELLCLIAGDQSSYSTGPSPLDIVVPLYIKRLVRNGKAIIKQFKE